MGNDRMTTSSREGSPGALAALVAAVAVAIAAAGVLGAALPTTWTTLPGATTPGGDVPSLADEAGVGG